MLVFPLAALQGLKVARAGGEKRRRQISGDCPAGPSVCHQKIEFICVIQMLMLSSPHLGCVRCTAEGRIGHWRWGGLAHIRAFVLCIKEL